MNPVAAPAQAPRSAVLDRGPAWSPAASSLGLGNTPSPKNILVIQLARLGDLVQTWPLLARLRQAYPGARLTLLTDRRLLPLNAVGPKMDEILGFDFLGLGSLAPGDWPGAYHQVAKILQDLRARGFDLVFNLNFSRLSLLLTHLLGAAAKGYLPASGGRDFLREPWLAWIYSLVHARRFNRFHLTDVFRHLAPEPDAAPRLPRPAAPPRGEPLIALQLATRHERRTWPLEHFTRLTEYLVSRLQARVLLLGTKAERFLGERLRAALPAALRENVTNLQGSTGLEELAGQLQQAQLLVSGDTGTLHLAAALGVPCLALFLGPALCFETGPYGEGHYVLQAEPFCSPCLEVSSPCPDGAPICLDMLPPLAVAQFISGWLTSGAAPISLPAGSRVYRSGLDNFGVRYQYLGDEPPRFADLVGQAYRQAGAWLAAAGVKEVGGGGQGPVAQASRLWTLAPCPNPPLPNPDGVTENISATVGEGLAVLWAALTQGKSVPPEMPEVAAALRPLLAFQGEMQQQGHEELFDGVKTIFTAQLASWLQNVR